MSTIRVQIVSAEKDLFDGNATMVVATAVFGEVGILPNHAPLLAALKPGQVRLFQEDGTETLFYLSGGFLEVQPKLVIILADTALRAADVDEASAIAAKERAENLLNQHKADIDYAHVRAELAEALAQISALAHYNKILKDKH